MASTAFNVKTWRAMTLGLQLDSINTRFRNSYSQLLYINSNRKWRPHCHCNTSKVYKETLHVMIKSIILIETVIYLKYNTNEGRRPRLVVEDKE